VAAQNPHDIRMEDWLKRKTPHVGSAWFDGAEAPSAESFARLAEAGIAATPGEASEKRRWTLALAHPQWGRAEAVCFKAAEALPAGALEFSGLSDGEKAAAQRCAAAVFVKVAGEADHVLADRKRLLRFLAALLGPTGVFAFDHVAMRVWPVAELAEELAHDADLDLESLFAVHAVLDARKQGAIWIHTHGLDSLGGFDFDFVQPERGRSFAWHAGFVRALAAAIVEGEATMGSTIEIAAGATVQLVPSLEFVARGDGHGHKLLGDLLRSDDGSHSINRAVVCETGRGFISKFTGTVKLRAARLPWSEGAEEAPLLYSPKMSALMAARARATYPVLRRYAGEFAALDCVAAVQLGYPTDDGGPRGREPLWFEVHNFSDTHVYATLESQPQNIIGMRLGDRGAHSTALITDWMLTTPLGLIRPSDASVARLLRQQRGPSSGAGAADPKVERREPIAMAG
jgi:hypothetical protein